MDHQKLAKVKNKKGVNTYHRGRLVLGAPGLCKDMWVRFNVLIIYKKMYTEK